MIASGAKKDMTKSKMDSTHFSAKLDILKKTSFTSQLLDLLVRTLMKKLKIVDGMTESVSSISLMRSNLPQDSQTDLLEFQSSIR